MCYPSGIGPKDIPVAVQNRVSQAVILPFVQSLGSTTLAASAVLNEYTVTVSSAVGIVPGLHIRIIDAPTDRFYAGEVVSVLGTVITLDSQIDFEYQTGSEVVYSSKNLGVDGSVTPQIFTARTGALSIPSNVDITRLIFTCITSSPE